MDVFIQQYRGDRQSFTHTVTKRPANNEQVKLSVPAEDLGKFYEALASETSPPAIMERMGKSTAYSIDLKVCSVPGDSIEEMLTGNSQNPGVIGFAQYAAANVAEVYGAAQPFLVYAGKYMDDRTTLPTLIMRAHFPGVLVNKDRHEKLTKKIKESVEYRTLNDQALKEQVVSLGEFLHRCCPDQNSWPTALKEQLDQEKKGEFRMVFADHFHRGAPAFDNCVMKPVAIFNSPHDRSGAGVLDDASEAEQATTHLKMATKRPMDCEDTKAEHENNNDIYETLKDGEYVTKWVEEPKIKKGDNRTGFGGSVDTEPGAKPRARNLAPDKRSNLNVQKFLASWEQVSRAHVEDPPNEQGGVITYEIKHMNSTAMVTINKNDSTATLVQGTQPNPGLQAVFDAAANAGKK
jgi:hypothetical protein